MSQFYQLVVAAFTYASILYSTSAYVYTRITTDPTVQVALWLGSWMIANVILYYNLDSLSEPYKSRYDRIREELDRELHKRLMYEIKIGLWDLEKIKMYI